MAGVREAEGSGILESRDHFCRETKVDRLKRTSSCRRPKPCLGPVGHWAAYYPGLKILIPREPHLRPAGALKFKVAWPRELKRPRPIVRPARASKLVSCPSSVLDPFGVMADLSRIRFGFGQPGESGSRPEGGCHWSLVFRRPPTGPWRWLGSPQAIRGGESLLRSISLRLPRAPADAHRDDASGIAIGFGHGRRTLHGRADQAHRPSAVACSGSARQTTPRIPTLKELADPGSRCGGGLLWRHPGQNTWVSRTPGARGPPHFKTRP